MAIFGQEDKSDFIFFDESLDDFEFLNEFDAGGNNDDVDEEDDDIQGMDDSDVDDDPEETPAEDNTPNTEQPDQTNEPEPTSDTTEENPVEDDGAEEDLGMDDTDTPDDDMGGDVTQPDNTGEDQGTEDSTGDNNMDDEGLDTIDDDSDGMDDSEGTDNPDGNGEDDMGDDSSSLDSTENDPHQRLKELEAEIFDQLSEPEKQMKINELKKLYSVLVDKADSLYKLSQEINKTDDNVKMIDYVLNTLMDLKTYLKDYIVDVYDNRTYLQNSVNFQKFLTIFDAVHSIFKEIKKQFDKED